MKIMICSMTKEVIYNLNPWEILEIESSSSVEQIKSAYSEKIKFCHPEDDAEGFKILNLAYKQAIKIAKSKKQPKITDTHYTTKKNIPKIKLKNTYYIYPEYHNPPRASFYKSDYDFYQNGQNYKNFKNNSDEKQLKFYFSDIKLEDTQTSFDFSNVEEEPKKKLDFSNVENKILTNMYENDDDFLPFEKENQDIKRNYSFMRKFSFILYILGYISIFLFFFNIKNDKSISLSEDIFLYEYVFPIIITIFFVILCQYLLNVVHTSNTLTFLSIIFDLCIYSLFQFIASNYNAKKTIYMIFSIIQISIIIRKIKKLKIHNQK